MVRTFPVDYSSLAVDTLNIENTIVEKSSNLYSAVVYKDGSTIIAEDESGNRITTGTDAVTVIQAAIDDAATNGGGNVLIARGTYDIVGASSILIKNNVILRGEGVKATKLVADPAFNTTMIKNSDFTNGNTDIGVFDMFLDANDLNGVGRTTGNCISWERVTRGKISRVYALNAYGSNLRLVNCVDLHVTDCYSEGAGNDNFLFQGPETLRVICNGCTAKGARAAHGLSEATGFEIADGANTVTLSNFIALDNEGSGVTVHNHASGTFGATTGPFNVTISNGVVDGGNGMGIQVIAQNNTGPRGVSISNCVVDGVTGNNDGFRVSFGTGDSTSVDVSNITINGCIARNCGRYGFYMEGNNIMLSDCIADTNSNNGFNLASASNRMSMNDCLSHTNTGNGFNITSPDCKITGCVARANTATGFALTNPADRTILTDCHSIENGTSSSSVHGFALGTATTTPADDVMIIGGSAVGNGGNGINLLGKRTIIKGVYISGNGSGYTSGNPAGILVGASSTESAADCIIDGCYIYNTTRNTGGTRNGIRFQNGTVPVDNVIVRNCIISDNRTGGSRTQDNGVLFSGTAGNDMATNIEVTNCLIRNNATNQISPTTGLNATIKLRDNLFGSDTAVRTINRGATSVADGGTISHGLAATPTRVIATGTVAGEIITVTAVGSTTFTVAVKNNDGTAGTTQTVYWEAAV